MAKSDDSALGCLLILVSILASIISLYFLYLAVTIGFGIEMKSWHSFIWFYLLYAVFQGISKSFVKAISKLD